jgi:DNA-binding Lrp family transcriptional regulator
VVDHLDAFGHGADRQLRVAGGADLARHHHVQRRAEPPRDGGGHDHAAARDAEDDRGVTDARDQGLGQALAGLDPVREPPLLPDTRSDPLGRSPVEHNARLVPAEARTESTWGPGPILPGSARSLLGMLDDRVYHARTFSPGGAVAHRTSQRGGLVGGVSWRTVLTDRGGQTRRSVLVVTAYILIQTEVGKAAQVAKEISEIKGVQQAEDVTGPYDVIVRAEARNVDDLGKLVVARVQAVDGITRTLTCPVVHL